MPGEVVVTPAPAALVDWQVDLRYAGEAIVTPEGESIPAGRPSSFGYARFFAPMPAGRHHVRVEYFEKTGDAELRVEMVKRF